MPGVLTGLCVTSPSAAIMSNEGVTRKVMNSSSELQFFHLVRQLVDISSDDSRTKTLKSLASMRNLQLSPKGFNQFRQECNDGLKSVMEILMQQQNKLWATTWVFIVEQMGQELHVDNKFLNGMLSILEQGMKRKDTVSMKWSLSCWQVLIDNFAIGQKMISTPRRVLLLTIPLKAKNVKELSVLEQKFKLWWHLLVSLREFVDMHTETVTKPFLVFTFGPFEQGESHLLNKFPGASSIALEFLTSFLATGVLDKELNELPAIRFKSSHPLINDSKVFLCLAEWIIKCTEILFKQPQDMMSLEFRVLISALIVRISTLCKDNTSFGSDMLALFLNMLKNTLFGLIVLNHRYKDLLLHATETALDVLPATIMDTKLKNLNHVTPRDFLFKLLCEKEHLLLQAKPTISKTDEKQSLVLGKLLITTGALVAHPDRLANAKLLVDTLVELQDLSQGEAARKCLHLWEQCSKILCKIPKESPNEQCNQITQKILWSMIVMPFKLILIKGTADCLNSAAAEGSVVKALKSLFFLYSEVEHLSLTVVASRQGGKSLPKKEDPVQKFYNTLSNLLVQEKYPAMACQVLIKVISKFASVRSNANYTKLFGKSSIGHEAEMAELKLLGKFTSLLISLAADTPQQTGKMCSYVAKGLENVVLLVSTPEATVEAINIFYELLIKTPLSFWPNNRMEVTDPWDSLVTPFCKIWLKKAEITARLPLLNSIKHKIEELTEHKDIKVCNTAREMLSRYSRFENDESSNSNSNTPVGTPINSRTTQTRKRSFMMIQSSPVPSQVKSPAQTTSPSRPSLEDLDSQDFVKIPSQTKMKKPLTPRQREVKRRRREDIPALYQGLSQDTQQSQDTQDDLAIIEFTKLPLTVSAPVWNEDAMDIDLASSNRSKSNENKSFNSQEDPEPITIDDENESKKPVDSQDIEIIENSQNYSTVPVVQSEGRPDIEGLVVARARNRQGVLLPPTQKSTKEIEIISIKDTAPINKRKSLQPVRGAGLKGRAAQMVGLATNTEPESKQADVSLPLMVMSSLMTKSSNKPNEQVNANDKSPKTKTTPIASVTPISSHKKRSNLKNTETPSPMRSKRVSFAEPIVSGEQDSPNILQDIQVYNNYYKQSPNTKKKMKASRKLHMAPKDGFQIIKEHSKAHCSLEAKLSSETEGLIEPDLIDCLIPISDIADKLASPIRLKHLITTLNEKNIKTVHDLNKLSETDIANLPIKEPKWASVKSALKFLKDFDYGEDEQDKDVTTEIETLPTTQPETLPSIVTVTTHADTIQVIEDVITSPEETSPTEPQETPITLDNEGNDEPMELPQSQEDPESEISQETNKDSPIIVESSLEPQPAVVTTIKDTQDATNITIPDTQDAKMRPPSPVPAKVLSAEETFAAMLPSDKEKIRQLILAETQSQELMDTLDARKENLLSNKSLSELVDEIKVRSCTTEVYKMLAASDSDFQTFIGNNADLVQLLQIRSEEEIVAALTAFSKHNKQTAVASMNKFLDQLESKHLADIFINIEDKVCNALPKSTLETKVMKDPKLCKKILENTEVSEIVVNLAERCAKGGASFTPLQASAIYPQIKPHVIGADSVREIFEKLQLKLQDGGDSEVKTEFQSRPQVRKLALDSSEQEEILTQLTLDSQDQQIKLSAKLSNDDMLAMATAKLLGQQNLIITTKMLRSLEQLAVYLTNDSLISVLKHTDLTEETMCKIAQVLTKKVDPAKLMTKMQLTTLVDGLIEDKGERSRIAAGVVSKSKEGELLLAVGGEKLISLMTLGVMNGDVKPVDSIQKIYCNSDTVAAACQIIKDGASDSQMGMVKEAIPRQVLASWVTDIIMK